MRQFSIIWILFMITLLSCEKQETLGYDQFYELYNADEIFLEVDRSLYIVGEQPIQFLPQVRDELNNILPQVKPLIVVESDTIDSYSYIPELSGELKAYAILPNGIKSNIVRINSITENDIKDIKITYDGVPYLTTNPWSIVRGFNQRITLKTGREYNLGSNVFPLTSDGLSFPLDKDYIEVPGQYNVFLELGSLRSNEIELNVRAEKNYEMVELPLVFHIIGTPDLIPQINNSVKEINALFNEPRLFIDENSNKVQTYISFKLANTAPQGSSLTAPGVHVIVNGESVTPLDQLNLIASNNYWDPNKYINIYVSRGDYSAITGGEFNPGGWANFAPILNEGLPGMFNLDEEPEEPFFNAVHLNASLWPSLIAHELGHLFSLYHNFDTGCSSTHGDYLFDTYQYLRTASGDVNCAGYPSLRKSNIMDYGGSGTIFTYDQRERLQLMMEYGLFIPTPNNQLKAREGQSRSIPNPIRVTDFMY